jgi:hypothetical protein
MKRRFWISSSYEMAICLNAYSKSQQGYYTLLSPFILDHDEFYGHVRSANLNKRNRKSHFMNLFRTRQSIRYFHKHTLGAEALFCQAGMARVVCRQFKKLLCGEAYWSYEKDFASRTGPARVGSPVSDACVRNVTIL